MSRTPIDPSPRLLLVTGPSGAGRSTALNAFEDLGFETIDNIPLRLIPRLFDPGAAPRAMALGLDVRNRDFSVEALLDIMAELSGLGGQSPELLYLDAEPRVLVRRYSETRRRHPLAPDGTPTAGIDEEVALLAPLREVASRLIDTTEMSPHDLRAELHAAFGSITGQPLALSVESFSYKRGLPRGADLVFDCRFLVNPHWDPALRGLTGRDRAVAEYIAEDARLAPFLDKVRDLLLFLLPAMQEEGKAHVLIAFGCTGGKHRSVAIAETLGAELAAHGWRVEIRHREQERRALDASSAGAASGVAP
jgi:UPF0042 nucleotide-binding protein